MDVWSFGVVIWETLARVKPYEGLDCNQIFIGVSLRFNFWKPKLFVLLWIFKKNLLWIIFVLINNIKWSFLASLNSQSRKIYQLNWKDCWKKVLYGTPSNDRRLRNFWKNLPIWRFCCTLNFQASNDLLLRQIF